MVMEKMLETLNENLVDKMADAMVEVMRFADSSVKYPELDGVKPDDGVMAEWFYSMYNGSTGFSELDAIHQYTSQEAQFEGIGNLMLGIALVEMKHYGKLAELITNLGGRINQRYDNNKVVIGNTKEEAIQNALDGENKTIEAYEDIIEKISRVKQTKTTEIVLQLLNKLIADEKLHVKLLNEQIENE